MTTLLSFGCGRWSCWQSNVTATRIRREAFQFIPQYCLSSPLITVHHML
ncbi:hypothetical protein QNH14_01265 [Apirhabdus apintestini]|nr:hypothetical protein QNH14_01265 [Enterobacteriaceae bacterium CA-0114]